MGMSVSTGAAGHSWIDPNISVASLGQKPTETKDIVMCYGQFTDYANSCFHFELGIHVGVSHSTNRYWKGGGVIFLIGDKETWEDTREKAAGKFQDSLSLGCLLIQCKAYKCISLLFFLFLSCYIFLLFFFSYRTPLTRYLKTSWS